MSSNCPENEPQIKTELIETSFHEELSTNPLCNGIRIEETIVKSEVLLGQQDHGSTIQPTAPPDSQQLYDCSGFTIKIEGQDEGYQGFNSASSSDGAGNLPGNGLNVNRLAMPQQAPADPLEPSSFTLQRSATMQDILKELIAFRQQINHRFNILEKRVADIAIQNELILDALRKQGSRIPNIMEEPEEPLEFWFNPIEREEELAELELRLADNDFNSKMIKWLRLNCGGDCADNRMLRVLDLLISKEMQTKCTWTGASRKGPKVAIMPLRNMLQLFIQIGSDDSETVTQQKLANFFMLKLKNSLKRTLNRGIRRGTRHVRRKKAETTHGSNGDAISEGYPTTAMVEEPYYQVVEAPEMSGSETDVNSVFDVLDHE